MFRKLSLVVLFAVGCAGLSNKTPRSHATVKPPSAIWVNMDWSGSYYAYDYGKQEYYWSVYVQLNAEGVKGEEYFYHAQIFDVTKNAWVTMYNPNGTGCPPSFLQKFNPFSCYDGSLQVNTWTYAIPATSQWGLDIAEYGDPVKVRGKLDCVGMKQDVVTSKDYFIYPDE